MQELLANHDSGVPTMQSNFRTFQHGYRVVHDDSKESGIDDETRNCKLSECSRTHKVGAEPATSGAC